MAVEGTKAVLRHSSGSPTKARQVLALIRGLDVSDAREVLRFTERGAAEEIAKLLDSAVANAEHNDNLPGDDLYVSAAWADEGPTAKRFRPRARGRGTRIRKRTSHITIVVSRYSDEQLRKRASSEAASGTGAAAERRRRLTRRRRVAASTAAAETHDHDHDHDEAPEVETPETAEVETPEVETAAAETTAADEESGADAAAAPEGVDEAEAAAVDPDEEDK
jgi:large subunit ribosomal protein L22